MPVPQRVFMTRDCIVSRNGTALSGEPVCRQRSWEEMVSVLETLTFAIEQWRALLLTLVIYRLFKYLADPFSAFRVIDIYVLSEFTFLLFSSHYKMSVQKRKKPRKPPTQKERTYLFDTCLANCDSHETFIKLWMDGRHPKELREGNYNEWFSWGFFGLRSWELSDSQKQEITQIVDKFRKKTGIEVKKGFNGKAKCLLVTHEPIEACFRPLLFYILVKGLLQDIITPVVFNMAGFKQHQYEQKSEEGDEQEDSVFSATYWILEGKSKSERQREGIKTQPPIVLFHGIGIGLLPYYRFTQDILDSLRSLKAKPNSGSIDRDLVLFEINAVSQHVDPLFPYRHRFVDAYKEILSSHGYEKSIVVGHSFGTFISTWLVHDAPEVVQGFVMIDPVTVFCHYPVGLKHVIYSQYPQKSTRPAESTSTVEAEDRVTSMETQTASASTSHDVLEKLVWVFMRGDLHLQRLFRREYCWWSYNLFIDFIDEDLRGRFILSRDDLMVPVDVILENFIEPKMRRMRDTQRKGNLQLELLNKCGHGDFLKQKSSRQIVANAILEVATNEPAEANSK